MRKSLVAGAIFLLSGYIASAQDKPSGGVMIQGTPEQVKKAAVAMFARDGYSIASTSGPQVKISKPFSEEETAAYNTAHWTNEPMTNCQHVHTLVLSPSGEVVFVKVASEMTCHSDGKWYFRAGDEKESERMQSALDTLKARTEDGIRRR